MPHFTRLRCKNVDRGRGAGCARSGALWWIRPWWVEGWTFEKGKDQLCKDSNRFLSKWRNAFRCDDGAAVTRDAALMTGAEHVKSRVLYAAPESQKHLMAMMMMMMNIQACNYCYFGPKSRFTAILVLVQDFIFLGLVSRMHVMVLNPNHGLGLGTQL